MKGNLNIRSKIAMFPKLIERLNAIPNTIPTEVRGVLYKIILKFTWNILLRIAKNL